MLCGHAHCADAVGATPHFRCRWTIPWTIGSGFSVCLLCVNALGQATPLINRSRRAVRLLAGSCRAASSLFVACRARLLRSRKAKLCGEKKRAAAASAAARPLDDEHLSVTIMPIHNMAALIVYSVVLFLASDRIGVHAFANAPGVEVVNLATPGQIERSRMMDAHLPRVQAYSDRATGCSQQDAHCHFFCSMLPGITLLTTGARVLDLFDGEHCPS